MRVGRASSYRCRRHTLTCLAAVLLLSWGGTASATGSAHKTRKLSLTNVTITTPATPSGVIIPLAIYAGIFKKLGLNVTWQNNSAGTAAVLSTLLGGGTDFIDNGVGSDVLAAEQGAPIRMLAMLSLSSAQEIAINASTAAAKNIPAIARTPAGQLAQFKALKGSHLTIAVSNAASNSYQFLYSLAVIHGLTIGPPPADINITSVGSTTAQVAALLSGKVDGIVGSPPTTVQPNAIEIPLWNIPPASNAASIGLVTTTTMIHEHPDTVQAVVTGVAQMIQFAHRNPKSAERYFAQAFATAGITSPEEVQYLFSVDGLPFMANPFMTRAAYNAELTIVNDSSSSPTQFPYSTFFYSRFIIAAEKKLGQHLP